MAVSTQYETLGLLNRWAARMNVPIFLFNQSTGHGNGAAPSSPGARIYTQPERENIAEGIVAALGLMTNKLRFHPRPVWLTETITLPAEDWLYRRGVVTRWAHVDAIGKRGIEVLSDGVSPLYSDTDSDGVNDLATLTVSDVPADLDVSQVRVYFSPNDTGAAVGDPRWEIEPLRSVELAGTTITIKAHRALFVKPDVWAQPYSGTNYNKSAVNAADVTSSDDFVDAVDVIREYPDTDGAALLRCNPYPEAPNTSPAAWDTFAADAVIEDGRLGLVNVRPQPDVVLTGAPTSLTLHYRAGYPLDDWGRMDGVLAAAVLRLANCHMPMRPGLDSASTELWLNDVAEDETEHGGKLGVLRGQVAAWRVCKALRILPSPRAV